MATARNIPLSANRGRHGGGRGGQRRSGWACKWSDQLKMGNGESAWIQLTPGAYPVHDQPSTMAPYLGLPMFKIQYTNERGYTSWGYFRESEGGSTLSLRSEAEDPNVAAPKYGDINRYFVGVIHYALYRRECVMKDGKPLLFSNGKLKGKPVFNWGPVTSIRERKQLLQSGDPEDIGLYRKKFIEMPNSHFKVVQEIGRRARGLCRCGTGTLFPSVFVCSGCEEVLLETEDSDMTDADVAAYGDQDIRCPHCGVVDFPRAEYDCDSCDDPRPHKYYEVAAQISRTLGDDGFPSYSLTSVISMANMVLADGSTRPVTGTDDKDEFTYDESLTKLISNQFDFDGYTAPKTDAEYGQMLGLRQGDIGYASSAKGYDNNFRR
jgi:hypothetical protein